MKLFCCAALGPEMALFGRAGRPLSSPLSRVKPPRQPENGAAVRDPTAMSTRIDTQPSDT